MIPFLASTFTPIADVQVQDFSFPLLAVFTVLSAVDIALRVSQRRSGQPLPAAPINAPTKASDPLKNLASRANQVLLDFQELERRLVLEKLQPKHLQILSQRQSKVVKERALTPYSSPVTPGCTSYPPVAYTRVAAKAVRSQQLSTAFTAFCERLLLMNHIWKQEQELKALRRDIRSTQKAKCSNAFKAFCDRLLLTNKVWKMEKEVHGLIEEGESLKRSRVAAVTRAAKKMVLDVQKDRLVEEFVKDLIVEVDQSKQMINTLRADHEREIQEITGEWSRDYRKLVREVERLKLGRDAMLVQQEVSNELEQAMFDRLATLKRKSEALEDELDRYATRSHTTYTDSDDGDDEETLSGGDMDDMTNLSSSTCVSLQERIELRKPTSTRSPSNHHTSVRPQLRPRLSSLRFPLRDSKGRTPAQSPIAITSPTRRVDTGPYAGFSFNPLFFGKAELTSSTTSKDAAQSDAKSSQVLIACKPTPLSCNVPAKPVDSSRSGSAAVDVASIRSLKRSKIEPWRV
ncbi:hypothetical protein BDQ12DRAFT_683611 [Crucibulum laeve]|uniref:Uncharacterized protein n=1 Tax=Crucibulum laeve TaxID=68775 RepID=A0A5C3LZM5_9AGAR|nr:hypothetical protein BDQ12DRAFT_683611 [Crucibulum laeve]